MYIDLLAQTTGTKCFAENRQKRDACMRACTELPLFCNRRAVTLALHCAPRPRQCPHRKLQVHVDTTEKRPGVTFTLSSLRKTSVKPITPVLSHAQPATSTEVTERAFSQLGTTPQGPRTVCSPESQIHRWLLWPAVQQRRH